MNIALAPKLYSKDEILIARLTKIEPVAAKGIVETGFDLITMYDCLHDMGNRGDALHICGAYLPTMAGG